MLSEAQQAAEAARQEAAAVAAREGFERARAEAAERAMVGRAMVGRAEEAAGLRASAAAGGTWGSSSLPVRARRAAKSAARRHR